MKLLIKFYLGEMAVKLGSALNTSAQFWLNAQQAVDIYNAIKKIKSLPQPITKASLG